MALTAPLSTGFVFVFAFMFDVFCFPYPSPSVSPQLSAPPKLADVDPLPLTKPVAAGERVVLRLKVTPRDGVSIYARGEATYKPVSLTIDSIKGVSAGPPVYPRSELGEFDGQQARVYRRSFEIEQPVRVKAPAGETVRVTGTLEYQACDDVMCYRPIKVSLGWDVPLR